MTSRLHFFAWPLCVLWSTYCVVSALVLALAQAVPPVMADTLSDALNTAPDGVINPPWLQLIGLQIDVFVAGLGGGYVHMMRTSKPNTTLASWTRYVIAAGLMGNYLPMLFGHVVPAFADLPSTAARGVAFFLGYGGFTFLAALQRLTSSTSTPLPPSGDPSP